MLALFGGFFLFRSYEEQQAFQSEPETIQEILILPDTIKVNGDSLSFRGKAGGRLYQAYYKLGTEQEKIAFQHLSDLTLLRIEGSLEVPEGQRNFSGFDYAAYLKSQGIYRSLKIERILTSQRIESLDILEGLSSLRRKAMVFAKTFFPQPMSNYMTGLLFGALDTDFEEMSNLYSSLGIIHLFALSGMQVGFFLEAFRKILLRLGLTVEQVNLLQYPFSLLYAGLTGFSVSVVRSLVQKLLGQAGLKGLDNFALTLVVLSLFMPNFLLTAGGVLSCAYAFILSMIDVEDLPAWKKVAVESSLLSLGILPILMFYFAEFQPWSLPLTFLFSFIFDILLLPLLSILFLLGPLVKIGQVNFLFEGLESLIRWVGNLASRPLVLGQPNIYLLLALLITLALLYDFRKKVKTRLILAFLVVSLLFLVKHPLQNEITVVDIGQGDSIFLRDMLGKTILIDTGGRVEVGQKEPWQERVKSANATRTLTPYLKSRGVGRLDSLVLTHTDTDHMGDMLEVAENFQIGEIYISPGSLSKSSFVKKLDQIKAKVHVVKLGDSLPIFDSQLEVLYPSHMGDGGNNDSIVLYGEFFKTKFLFTGDLEKEGEEELMRDFPQLKVDVLKAGHHGSKGSSSLAFLDQLEAKVALISAGKNNRYKHPHKETLERFEERGMRVYRTDQEGAIRFQGWTSWRIETVR